MTHHAHVHMIVPGGGLSPEGSRWIAGRPKYFLPREVLSALFRGLMLNRHRVCCSWVLSLPRLRTLQVCQRWPTLGVTELSHGRHPQTCAAADIKCYALRIVEAKSTDVGLCICDLKSACATQRLAVEMKALCSDHQLC
jgi:Putative transposase